MRKHIMECINFSIKAFIDAFPQNYYYLKSILTKKYKIASKETFFRNVKRLSGKKAIFTGFAHFLTFSVDNEGDNASILSLNSALEGHVTSVPSPRLGRSVEGKIMGQPLKKLTDYFELSALFFDIFL